VKTTRFLLNGNHFIFIGLLVLSLSSMLKAHAVPPKKDYYNIIVYHLKDAAQEARVDSYLKDAYLPALHKAGIKTVGVFKPVGNDTTADKRIYVFIPGTSVEQLLRLPAQVANLQNDYTNAAWDQPAYLRMESIILEAFPGMPQMAVPALTSPKSERVYELRSYESASEKLHQNKVQMFNKGDEVGIFKRLGFNAVFYADVLSGSHMPNLMYMTTFDNMAAREEHWKAFSNDPQWKKLLPLPEYAHNVSHQDIIFIRPTEYSEI
jgi:hypothetical protein